MRGWFVTGTGTGVGKTVLSACIVAALRARGELVVARKPVVTGLDDPRDPDWPRDHELLAMVSGSTPEQVSPQTFGPAVAPHLAAALAGTELDPVAIVRAVREAGPTVVVEGVGGLLVPLAERFDVADLAAELGLPLLVAAHPGLGTINHALLTLEAARSRGLLVKAIVLTPWPDRPAVIERSNRETIERAGGVQVAVLPRIPRADPLLLAQAGAALPLDDW
ncbi:MAG TPA: dethiobiotin synthase [Solirubrobacteraceae bacterium]|nr:dethiobiotin synthase [Solirubrobacteraceae bacterium]